MKFIDAFNNVKRSMETSSSDDDSESGDKYLDYLRSMEQKRRNEIEKKYLKRKLKNDDKRRFERGLKSSFVKSPIKKKYKNFKLKL